jgi:hypothetical protein
LPHELKQLFRECLDVHYPDKAAHIISLIQQMNGGKDYDSNFATRMRWQGIFTDIIRKRAQVDTRKPGLHRAWDSFVAGGVVLSVRRFRVAVLQISTGLRR